MKYKATIGPYSSVVGQSVHLTNELGQMAGQVIILGHIEELRDRDATRRLLVKIAAAINEESD